MATRMTDALTLACVQAGYESGPITGRQLSAVVAELGLSSLAKAMKDSDEVVILLNLEASERPITGVRVCQMAGGFSLFGQPVKIASVAEKNIQGVGVWFTAAYSEGSATYDVSLSIPSESMQAARKAFKGGGVNALIPFCKLDEAPSQGGMYLNRLASEFPLPVELPLHLIEVVSAVSKSGTEYSQVRFTVSNSAVLPDELAELRGQVLIDIFGSRANIPARLKIQLTATDEQAAQALGYSLFITGLVENGDYMNAVWHVAQSGRTHITSEQEPTRELANTSSVSIAEIPF